MCTDSTETNLLYHKDEKGWGVICFNSAFCQQIFYHCSDHYHSVIKPKINSPAEKCGLYTLSRSLDVFVPGVMRKTLRQLLS